MDAIDLIGRERRNEKEKIWCDLEASKSHREINLKSKRFGENSFSEGEVSILPLFLLCFVVERGDVDPTVWTSDKTPMKWYFSPPLSRFLLPVFISFLFYCIKFSNLDNGSWVILDNISGLLKWMYTEFFYFINRFWLTKFNSFHLFSIDWSLLSLVFIPIRSGVFKRFSF